MSVLSFNAATYFPLKKNCFSLFNLGRIYCLPYCGSQDESLIHFVCESVELNEWRRERYGKEKLNEVCMVDRMKETHFLSIKRIARFVRIAAAHRERFL